MQHVWGRGKVHTVFWWGSLRERDCLGDPEVDGSVILKQVFKWDVEHGLDESNSVWGQLAGCCECGNELPYFVISGEFLCLSEKTLGQVTLGSQGRICPMELAGLGQVLKKVSVAWSQLGQVGLGYVRLGSQRGLCSMDLVGLGYVSLGQVWLGQVRFSRRTLFHGFCWFSFVKLNWI